MEILGSLKKREYSKPLHYSPQEEGMYMRIGYLAP
jgi:hypothetical protein